MQIDAHLDHKQLHAHVTELNELYLDTLRAAYDQRHVPIIEERFLVDIGFCERLFSPIPASSQLADHSYDQVLLNGATGLLYTVHPLLLSEQTPGVNPAYINNFFEALLTYICLGSNFTLARDASIKIQDLLTLKSMSLSKRRTLARSIDISTRPRFSMDLLYAHVEQPSLPIKLIS